MWSLAFDAGGSHTRAVLQRGEAPCCSSFVGRAGPGNLKTLGTQAALQSLLEAFEQALRAAGLAVNGPPGTDPKIAGLACCIAGASAGTEALQRSLAAQFGLPLNRTLVLPDYEAVLGLGPEARPRLALIAGTGSIAVAVDADGRRWRAGGRGPRSAPQDLGDPGSGYWLAGQIAQAAGLAFPPGASPADLAGQLAGWLERPPLPPAALEQLIEAAAEALAQAVERAHRAAGLAADYPLFLSGGLALGSPALRAALVRSLTRRGHQPALTLVPEAWRGALALAQKATSGGFREPTVSEA